MKKILLSAALFTTLTGAALASVPLGSNAQLFFTGTAAIRYDDNILQQDTGPLKISDTIVEIDPGVELDLGNQNALAKTTFNYSEAITRYLDTSKLNTELSQLSLNTTFDNGKTTAGFGAAYRQLNQNSPTSGTPGLLRRNITSVNANGEFEINAKSSLAIGASYEKTAYKVAGLVDSNIYTVPLTYYYVLNPKLSLSAGFRYRKTDLQAPSVDSKDYFYNVGVRLKTNAKLNGHISVGYNQRKPDAGKTESSIGVDSGVSYDYSAITRFTLNVSNDFGSASAGQTQKKFTVDLGGQTQLTTTLIGFADISFNAIKYPGTRKDDYWEGSVGLKWILNQNAQIVGSYIYRKNSSTGGPAGLDFRNNVIALSAVLRY